jgi:hypothetical protein
MTRNSSPDRIQKSNAVARAAAFLISLWPVPLWIARGWGWRTGQGTTNAPAPESTNNLPQLSNAGNLNHTPACGQEESLCKSHATLLRMADRELHPPVPLIVLPGYLPGSLPAHLEQSIELAESHLRILPQKVHVRNPLRRWLRHAWEAAAHDVPVLSLLLRVSCQPIDDRHFSNPLLNPSATACAAVLASNFRRKEFA